MFIIKRLLIFYGLVACYFPWYDLVSYARGRTYWRYRFLGALTRFHIWDAMIPRRRGGLGWSVCGGFMEGEPSCSSSD